MVVRSAMETIWAADSLARSHFTYQADPARQDRWRSHMEEATARKPWKGDCDDLASTVLDILDRDGLDPRYSWRLLVNTVGDDSVDHMVGMVEDVRGRRWVVGDTFEPAYPLDLCKHRILQACNSAERGSTGEVVWREWVRPI